MRAGEQVAEIETDKATFTVEAEQDGYVLSVHGKEGDILEVGSILMWMGAARTNQYRPKAPLHRARRPPP